MKLKLPLAILIAGTQLVLFSHASAALAETEAEAGKARSNMKEALASYDAGDYRKAMDLCKKVLIAEPSNLTAHYVMGNICVKCNQIRDAKAQYSYCVQAGKDSSEAGYAKQALDQIEQQKNSPTPSPAGVSHASGTAGSGKGAEEYIQEQTDRLLSEAKEKIAVKQRVLDDKIKEIQSTVQQDVVNISQGASRGAANRAAKRDAEDEVRQNAQHSIDELRKEFEKQSEDINQSYQSRINALSEHYRNMDSHSGAR
jgi:tetratricopeptide (TPR) repeat protein